MMIAQLSPLVPVLSIRPSYPLPETRSIPLLTDTLMTDPDVLEGMDIGCEMALGDAESGRPLRNEADLWQYVQGECAPEHIERERESDEAHGFLTPTIPFRMRLGSLIGYLVTTLAIQAQSVEGGKQ